MGETSFNNVMSVKISKFVYKSAQLPRWQHMCLEHHKRNSQLSEQSQVEPKGVNE